MLDRELGAERRCAVIETITAALVAACPASAVQLRGSLAIGGSDPYSDIDLAWIVPDALFESCVAGAARALAAVGPIQSVRSDPDAQRSRKRRLLFVRFVHLPLFWRVDRDVRAQSIAADEAYDLHNPRVRGDDWSHAASALENAAAAIKALRRDQADVARGLPRARIRPGPATPPRAIARRSHQAGRRRCRASCVGQSRRTRGRCSRLRSIACSIRRLPWRATRTTTASPACASRAAGRRPRRPSSTACPAEAVALPSRAPLASTRPTLPAREPGVKVTARIVLPAFKVGDAPYLRTEIRRTWE